MPDSTFEQAFANLAHANLRDKVPGLMEYLVGFQVIDKNDEETHAVGIFGFNIGDQWLYAPIFFLNGALKGTDLLYIKNRDMFVPLADNWVNYLLSKQPQKLGEPEQKRESEIGLEGPDFRIFAESPQTGTKWASYNGVPRRNIKKWALPFFDAYKSTVDGTAVRKRASITPSLDKVLNKWPALAMPLAIAMKKNAKFTEAALRFYDIDKLLPSPQAIKQAFENQRDHMIQSEPKDVVILTADDVTGGAQVGSSKGVLSNEEMESLMKGEVIIKDHRTNKSRLYEGDFNRTLSNPTETGVYEVLGADGGFKNCLIICSPKTIGDGETRGVCTLVTNDGHYGNFRNVELFVRNMDATRGNFIANLAEYWNKAVELDSMKSGYKYVMFAQTGHGTIPFKFLRSVAVGNGQTQYLVKGDTCVIHGSSSSRGSYDHNNIMIREDNDKVSMAPRPCSSREEEKKDAPYDLWELESSKAIVTTNRPVSVRMVHVGGTTIIPEGKYKAYEISKDYGLTTEQSATRFSPGGLTVAEMAVIRQGARPLFVKSPGEGRITIRLSGDEVTVRKDAALKLLVTEVGLDGEDARYIVKRAGRDRDKYFVKFAVQYGQLQLGASNAPPMPMQPNSYSGNIAAGLQYPQTYFETVKDLKPRQGNEEFYRIIKDEDIRKAIQASNKGQKDVFDTSVISGLVKTVDVAGLIDGFVPDMIRGMDRIGRTLFVFYWHNETFRERYGRQDLIDLEDSLRNVFTSMGDLILFLKQKTIESNPEAADLDMDLTATAE